LSTLVLVGGTGSLSKAVLSHQKILKENGITRIRVISRCEIKQADLEQNYSGEIELQCFLGDIRNKERMEFALNNSQYVIHMAALKQIERFELDVEEGYETNIFGTKNVAKAALKNNLQSSIFVSTDKAFQPINSYGVSKLAASHLWLWFNSFQKKVKFGVCSYGNVWGSRGSVIERWREMAEEERPLPITDERMTRFFITKSDAAEFVLKSLFNNTSSMMIPNMKSIEMVKVAELINKKYGSTAGIKIIGLRDPREKIHEDLGSMNSNTAPRFTEEELNWMIDRA